MAEDVLPKALDFHKKEGFSNANLSFMEIKREDEYAIIPYSLKAYYTNSWLRDNFPSVNVLLLIIILSLFLINTLLVTLVWARRLARELDLNP